MSKSVKPTPSSTASTVKYLGAFGDHLQSGIIFIRLLTGETVPVLGIVCASTNDHAAKVLKSRHVDDVLASIMEIWYKPLGLPMSIAVDADSLLAATRHGINILWASSTTSSPQRKHGDLARLEKEMP